MFSILLDWLEKIKAKKEKKARKNKKIRFLKAAPFLKKGTYFSNETGFLWYPKRWKEKALPENKYLIQQIIYANERASRANTKIGKCIYTIKRKLADRLHCKRVTLKDHPSFYDGDVAILSRETGAGRVINYSKKEILSFFRNREQMQDLLEKRNVWQGLGFAVPAILQTDEARLFFTEEYIEKREYPPEQGFEFIKKDILLHQKGCGDQGLIFCTAEELAEKVKQIEKAAEGWDDGFAVLDFVRSGNYVKRICHGDLYRNNLIFDGQSFRYIDFEKVAPRIFFLDIIFYMVNDFLRFNNDKLLNAFFAGEYDAYFQELFAVNHCVYDPSMKKVYYFLTLFEYFCESFNSKIPLDLKSAF